MVDRSGLVEKITKVGAIVLRTWVTPEELRLHNERTKHLSSPTKLATPTATPDPSTPEVAPAVPPSVDVPTTTTLPKAVPKRTKGRPRKYKDPQPPTKTPDATPGSPTTASSSTAVPTTISVPTPSPAIVQDPSIDPMANNINMRRSSNEEPNSEWAQWMGSMHATAGYDPVPYMPQQPYVTGPVPLESGSSTTPTSPHNREFMLDDIPYIQPQGNPTSTAPQVINKAPRSRKKSINSPKDDAGSPANKKPRKSIGGDDEPKRTTRDGDAEPLFYLMSEEELSNLRKKNRRGKTWIPGHISVCRYLTSLGRPLEEKRAKRIIWLKTHPGEPFPPYLEPTNDKSAPEPSNGQPATPTSQVQSSVSPTPGSNIYSTDPSPAPMAPMYIEEPRAPQYQDNSPYYPPMLAQSQYLETPAAPIPQASPIAFSGRIQTWQENAEDLQFKNPYYYHRN